MRTNPCNPSKVAAPSWPHQAGVEVRGVGGCGTCHPGSGKLFFYINGSGLGTYRSAVFKKTA